MLRICLLGEQVVEDEITGEIRSRSARTLALVGYLAVHGAIPQGRQQLAGLFWPDSTDAQALTNLRRELHHLRRLLGEDGSLEVSSTDLCWRDTSSCDVDLRTMRRRHAEARRARDAGQIAAAVRLAGEAVAAYGGDFLPASYDGWAVTEREVLRRECVQACDLLVEVASRHGDLGIAVQACRRRIALEPLEEVGYRSLMALQVESGDRGGAVSTYHHCASVLRRELGIAPDATTRRAVEPLIGRPAAVPGSLRTDQPRSELANPALVGRADQLRGLREHWEAAVRDERAALLVVRGVAGVGKSRLVAELAAEVRSRRGVVAAAQCFDTSGRLALAPVSDWLRTSELRAAAQGLDPMWREEVARLVPEVVAGAGTDTWGAGGQGARHGNRAKVDAWQRHRFFEGLAQPFLAVRRPLLLVLDNLQWCDHDTLSWLSFLLRADLHRRLMLAVTTRDAAPGDSDVSAWVTGMRTGLPVQEVTLAPLRVEQAATLSAQMTGSVLTTEQSALLHATTGGFPLFVIEAARATAGGPLSAVDEGERLGSVLRRRIEQASPHARQTACLAAALGRNFSLDLLTDASDLDEDTVARSVDELWRRHIVRELGTGYDFSHDLLRDAAYQLVSPPQRWLLHRRLAQALELSAGGQDDDQAALLAEQYDRGGRPDRAREHYARAAEVAAGRFAIDESVALHRRALAIITAQPPGRQRDQRELDCLLTMAAPLNASQGYSSPALREVLDRAVGLAEQIGSRRGLVASLVGQWASSFVQGDVVESLRIASRALTLSEVGDVLLGEAHFAYAGSSASLGRPAEAVRHFDLAHDLCRGSESLAVGTMPDVHALAWAAHAHWLLGQREAAEDRAVQALDRARAAEHPYSLAAALAYAAVTYQLLEDHDALEAAARELATLSERYGFAYYPDWGLVLSGWQAGDEEGVATMRRGIGRLRRQRAMARMPYWLSLLADTLVCCDRDDEAVATLDAARTAAGSHGDAWWLPEIIRQRAGHATPDQGRRLLHSGLRLAERQGSQVLTERCRTDLAALSDPAVPLPPDGDPMRPNAEGTAAS